MRSFVSLTLLIGFACLALPALATGVIDVGTLPTSNQVTQVALPQSTTTSAITLPNQPLGSPMAELEALANLQAAKVSYGENSLPFRDALQTWVNLPASKTLRQQRATVMKNLGYTEAAQQVLGTL